MYRENDGKSFGDNASLPESVGPDPRELNSYGRFVTQFLDDRPSMGRNVISGICRQLFGQRGAATGGVRLPGVRRGKKAVRLERWLECGSVAADPPPRRP